MAIFELPEETRELRDAARRLAQNVLLPRAAQIDESDEFPWDIKEVFAENDLLAMPFGEEYGGLGASNLTFCAVIEEIARVSASASMIIGAQCLGTTAISLSGTEEQKKKYFPKLAKGEFLAAFALTEPDAGSDVGGIKTTAVPDGNHYILNGSKRFITQGSIADVLTVFAQVPDKVTGEKRLSCFILEKGTPGFSPGKIEHKMGLRGSPTAELFFDDCRIPKENLVGSEGEGFKIAMRILDKTRPSVAAQAVGIAQGALDEALKYARVRTQFNTTLGKFEGIQFMLADMETQIQAARHLVYVAADKWDHNAPDHSRFSAMAKLFATDVCMQVTTDAVQIHGGYGYIKEYPVERMMRDAKIQQIVEGTNQIQRIVIARSLLGRDF